jgi:hypothetical protein
MSRTALTTAVLAAMLVTSTPAAARPPVPASLSALESSAEDLVDVALAHDRSGVVDTAGELRARAEGGDATRALAAAGVPAATLAELRRRAQRTATLAHGGAFIQVALAANAVSELVPGLYARFADPVPPAVGTLDYLDREAELRSLAGQRAAVPPLVQRLSRTWAGVRPRVRAHGGGSVAGAFDHHVAAMTRLAPAGGADLRREAEHGLALVDDVEQVFG